MDPRRAIRQLFREVDGYDIPVAEEKAVLRSRGDPLYGELTPAGCARLIEELDLGPRDVFYDLGSGVGKVVLQVAIASPIKRCVGYELSETRCQLARSTLLRARRQGLIRARTTVFRQLDMLKAPMQDATVVYTCTTAFTERFMKSLMNKLARQPKPLTVVALGELDEHRSFELLKAFPVRTSWNPRSWVYIYRVTPRSVRAR